MSTFTTGVRSIALFPLLHTIHIYITYLLFRLFTVANYTITSYLPTATNNCGCVGVIITIAQRLEF